MTAPPFVRPKSASAMQSKRVEVLSQIAARYVELVEPCGKDGIRGDGTGVSLMPRTYTATVKEFERLMGVMRNQAKQQAYAGWSLGKLRWHVLEWYVNAQPVVRSRPLLVTGKGGKLVPAYESTGERAMVRTAAFIRNPDAREDRALLGLGWMAEAWALKIEPMLPQEIVVGLRSAA
jgi:hypothetical protein